MNFALEHVKLVIIVPKEQQIRHSSVVQQGGLQTALVASLCRIAKFVEKVSTVKKLQRMNSLVLKDTTAIEPGFAHQGALDPALQVRSARKKHSYLKSAPLGRTVSWAMITVEDAR